MIKYTKLRINGQTSQMNYFRNTPASIATTVDNSVITDITHLLIFVLLIGNSELYRIACSQFRASRTGKNVR